MAVFDCHSTPSDSIPTYNSSDNSVPTCIPTDPKSKPSLANDVPSKQTQSSSVSRSRIEKRRANTLAARRYRQNRLDRLSELETALKETQLERDALKEQVARLQGETQVLRDLVHKPAGSSIF